MEAEEANDEVGELPKFGSPAVNNSAADAFSTGASYRSHLLLATWRAAVQHRPVIVDSTTSPLFGAIRSEDLWTPTIFLNRLNHSL